MTLPMPTNRLRHRGLWLFLLLIGAALVLSACDLVGDDSDDEEQQQQAQPEQVQQAESGGAAPPAAAPAASRAAQPAEEVGREPPPQAEGGGEGATAYSIVFPSLAHVITPGGVATGLVIADGYVIVDEGALGGAMAADVMLSNGETLAELPVVGRDQFTGLAYLGPLDPNLVRRLPGARLGDGEGIRPGSSVFAIGYAVGDRPDALPSVYSGVLSGLDEWEAGQRTFLRSDARPPGVTAGMVMVDGAGTVIGVAPASLVGLGWYVSTGDLARSLPPAAIVPARSLDPSSASMEHTLSIGPLQRSTSLYIADEATGETISMSIAATEPALLQLIDANGEVLQDSNLIAGATIISVAPDTVGPYRLAIIRALDVSQPDAQQSQTVSGAMPAEAVYRITSSAELMSVAEVDEMAPLVINTPLVGTIDIAGDQDSFDLAVRADSVYEVQVQSLLFDTVLFVEGVGLDGVDDDTGGGPFGTDSALTLAPQEDGVVRLTVKDYADERTGAYVLTVTQIAGEPPAEESAMADAAGSVVGASLPSPMADLSLRGEITDDGLRPTLIGIGSELDVDNALVVPDQDGIFEVIVTVIGTNESTARLYVFDEDDQVVVSGRVILNCETADPCLSSAVFITPEDSPGPPGTWRVLLRPEGAATGISAWQLEVHLYEDIGAPIEAEADEG